MARDRKPPPGGGDSNWDRTLRLFQAGSPEFVEAIRQRVNANALAPFAETWYTDTRIEARRFLFAYLERPLNAARRSRNSASRTTNAIRNPTPAAGHPRSPNGPNV